MTTKNEKVEVQLADADLEAAIRVFAHYRSERLEIAKLEEAAKGSLLELLDGYQKEYGADTYRTSPHVSVTVRHYEGQGRIDGQILLEKGVDPEIIKLATKRTPYSTYTPNV